MKNHQNQSKRKFFLIRLIEKLVKTEEEYPGMILTVSIIAVFSVSLVVLSNFEYLSTVTWSRFSKDAMSVGIIAVFLSLFLGFMGLLFGEIKIKRSKKWYLIRFVFDTKNDPNEPEYYLA